MAGRPALMTFRVLGGLEILRFPPVSNAQRAKLWLFRKPPGIGAAI
jgi:hypothetical protein